MAITKDFVAIPDVGDRVLDVGDTREVMGVAADDGSVLLVRDPRGRTYLAHRSPRGVWVRVATREVV